MSFGGSLYRSIFNGNGIARRLSVAIILFSSAITVVTTAIQLYGQYDRQVGDIHRAFREIELTQVPLLVNSVWSADAFQIQTQINGLTKRSDIVSATVETPEGRRWMAETAQPRYPIVVNYPLWHSYRGQELQIGQLTLVASRDAVLWRVGSLLVELLVSNAVKTFLVAIFILLMFQLLVTQHLYALANYTRSHDLADPETPPARLDRRPGRFGRPDALDQLTNALNGARQSLIAAQDDLRRSMRDYRAIFDDAPVGLLRFDTAGRLLRANGAFWRMLGYEGEAPPDGGATSLADLLEREEDRSGLDRDLAAGSAHLSHDVQLRRGGGSPLTVHLEARRIADDGDDHYEASVTDLSTRLAAEDGLRRALEAAELASRAKSQFLARVSHELRTPLNAVIGFSELLAAAPADKVAERYREYARDIHGAGRHLLRLIDDLIDIARVEAGQFELREEPVDVGRAVEASVALVEPQAGKVGVALAVEDRSAGHWLLGDATRIRQIVVNLISNAVDFSPAGSTVQVRSWLDDAGRIRLSVEDHGVGIAPADRERVFEPFVQIQDAYVRGRAGAGLGLSLVRSFVRLHDGEIRIDEAPGGGTLITVAFPARRTLPPEPSGEA